MGAERAFSAATAVPVRRRVRQAAVESDLVAVLVQPLPEFRPVVEQSLVGDLGDRPAVLIGRERDQAPIRIGKDL